MKTEIENEITAIIDRELGVGLTEMELRVVKAIALAAYDMGFDHGKSILELINADEVLTTINQKTK